jgi:hypothetical protein
MALRFLLLLWPLPFASCAQISHAGVSAPGKPSGGLPESGASQALTLTGWGDRRITELAAPTHLYRHLRDSSRQPVAGELTRGLFVIVRKAYPGWLAVNLALSPTHGLGDTTTYYVRSKAFVGSTTRITW